MAFTPFLGTLFHKPRPTFNGSYKKECNPYATGIGSYI